VATALGYELYETWTCRSEVDPRCRVVGGDGAAAGDGDCGIALLTRVPRGAVSEHHLGGFVSDMADRKLIRADVELDGGPLTVCTSHFPHLEHFSPLLRWRLRPALPDVTQPAVLMGDFNMWRWVSRFVVPGWRDTVRGPTWPAHRRPMFQIDHLLTTSPVDATDTEVVDVGESDHLPIRAQLSVR